MRLLDSRRLTGPNLMLGARAVIAEVSFEPGEDAACALEAWRSQLRLMLEALGDPAGPAPEVLVREYRGGAALVVTAPLDLLLPMTDVNEWAVASAGEVAAGRPALPLEPRRTELAASIEAARDPALLAIAAAAAAHAVPLLLDDKLVTAGMAARSRTWPRGQVPAPGDVPWNELGTIPIALVTGTNGKTTSTRLVARIARCAGLVAGATSTDGVAIDGALVEAGDYTGPAGALAVLRRPEVQLAVLETARGGILRRGLAVESCDAALITNVSADHLGDYGIDDLETMARVKAVVARAARTVVLNAEDASLVRLAPSASASTIWFAVDPSTPALAAHRARGGEVWCVEDGAIVRARGASEVILRVDEAPITFGGRARYNVENALGAAALASALGIDATAIRAGLRSFTSSAADNPGRGNIAELASGVRVLVDFGHNPAGLERVLAFARSLAGAAPITVISGMPGDRLDEEMYAVSRQLALSAPHRIILRELHGYLRGREPGAIPAILTAALAEAGYPRERIVLAGGELDAVKLALEDAQAGELIAVLPSIESAQVRAYLGERGATWW